MVLVKEGQEVEIRHQSRVQIGLGELVQVVQGLFKIVQFGCCIFARVNKCHLLFNLQIFASLLNVRCYKKLILLGKNTNSVQHGWYTCFLLVHCLNGK